MSPLDARCRAPRTPVFLSRLYDDVDFYVRVDRDAILLVTDSYSRGWRVRSPAAKPPQEYQILPANYAVQALPLRGGAHRIRLEYAPLPLGFRIGRWVSAGSMAADAGVLLWWMTERRRPLVPLT